MPTTERCWAVFTEQRAIAVDQTSIILGVPVAFLAVVELSKLTRHHFSQRPLEVSYCPDPCVEFLLGSDVSAPVPVKLFGNGSLVNPNNFLPDRVTGAAYRIVGRRLHVKRRTLLVVPAKVQIFDDATDMWKDSDHVEIPKLSPRMQFRIEGCTLITFLDYVHLHRRDIWLEIDFHHTGQSSQTVFKSNPLSLNQMTKRQSAELRYRESNQP